MILLDKFAIEPGWKTAMSSGIPSRRRGDKAE